MDAEIDAVVPDRGTPISLRGTSRWSGNIVGYYEKDRFSARVAYNLRSDFLFQEASSNDRFDEFTEGQKILDVNVGYKLSENFRLRFTANNLTNSMRKRIWQTGHFSDQRDNGRTFVLELRATL